MADLSIVVPATLVSAGLGWFGQVIMQGFKNRGERVKVQADTDIRLEEHRDKLTFDLLSAARGELAAARSEVAELRPLQAKLAQMDVRLAHFEEALELIERLMGRASEEERKATERQARAFVNRMRRLSEAHGTMLNELQREQSAATLPTDMVDKLNKLS